MSELPLAIEIAKNINADVQRLAGPPSEGRTSFGTVIPASSLRNTRTYVEKIANQINGSYENGWYDAAAVMTRRIIETLIIECFESKNISEKIKNSNGDFFFLRDLISATLSESSWNLTRNCKSALPKLKDIGDKSAHSRRYIAHRQDISDSISDIRVVVQELAYLSGIKR